MALSGRPSLGGVGVEVPVAILGQPVGRSDPQRAIRRGRQRGDGIGRQIALGLVEYREFVAVEARQALVGSQPEVAVGGLRDGADGVLRQPVLLGPRPARILREALAGIERPGAGRRERRQQTKANPTGGHLYFEYTAFLWKRQSLCFTSQIGSRCGRVAPGAGGAGI